MLVRADTKLSPQLIKVHAAAAVLELAGNLHLLGLGSAAPHWLDPLERTGARSGLLVTALIVALSALMLAGFLAQLNHPPPLHRRSTARLFFRAHPKVPALGGSRLRPPRTDSSQAPVRSRARR